MCKLKDGGTHVYWTTHTFLLRKFWGRQNSNIWKIYSEHIKHWTHKYSSDWGIKKTTKTKLQMKTICVYRRTNRLLSFDTKRKAQKTAPPKKFRCSGNMFTETLPCNDRGIHRQTERLSVTARTPQKTTCPTILCFVYSLQRERVNRAFT
jgi:hypothetical protein